LLWGGDFSHSLHGGNPVRHVRHGAEICQRDKTAKTSIVGGFVGWCCLKKAGSEDEMTSRDTHDIEAYAEELKLERTTNIQPALLIKLLMESEPCLFYNQSEPLPVINGVVPKLPQFENVIWREE